MTDEHFTLLRIEATDNLEGLVADINHAAWDAETDPGNHTSTRLKRRKTKTCRFYWIGLQTTISGKARCLIRRISLCSTVIPDQNTI